MEQYAHDVLFTKWCYINGLTNVVDSLEVYICTQMCLLIYEMARKCGLASVIKVSGLVSVICDVQYIPRNMHTVFALLCFVVVMHWLIFPYPSGLLHWHCGNLTIASVPAKQPWWIWINTSCEFIMNACVTTTKQSTTKPCAYFLGYTVVSEVIWYGRNVLLMGTRVSFVMSVEGTMTPYISSWMNGLWNGYESFTLKEYNLYYQTW